MNAAERHGRWSRFFFAGTVLTIAAASIRNLWDQDVWWNLAAGRWIWEHHAIPRVDAFSFTVQGHPWIDHEWFFQALLFGAYKLAAIPGVLLLKACLIAVAAAGLWTALPRECPPILRSALTLTAFYWMGFRNMARPDLMLFAIFPWIIGAYLRWWAQPSPPIRRIPRAAWGCTLAMLVLANSHGGFLSILLATLLFALCWAWRHRRANASLLSNPYAICFALYLPAMLLNPYGVHLIGGIVHTAFRLERYDGFGFSEYRPSAFSEFPAFWLFYIAWGSLLLWQSRRGRSVDMLAFTFFLYDGLLAHMFRRNIPLGVFIAIPFVAYACRTFLHETKRRWAYGAGALLLLGCFAREAKAMQWSIQQNRYPIRLAEFMRTQLEHGTCYNDYDLGSFLIWDWYGSPLRVFIDGRLHAVQGYVPLWQDVQGMAGINPEALTLWQRLLDRWKFDAAAIQVPPFPIMVQGRPISKLAYFFPSHRWALLYVDAKYALYVRRSAYPAALIRRWEIPAYFPDTRSTTASTAIPWKNLISQ